MKTIPFLFLFLVVNVQAQLSAKEERIVQKAEKYYERGNLYKAISVFEPVLEKNKYEHNLWDIMLKYQRERLENTIAMQPKNIEEEKNKGIALDLFVKDFVFTLMDAIHYYKNLEELCCNVQTVLQAKAMKSYERDFSSAYGEIFKKELEKLKTTCR